MPDCVSLAYGDRAIEFDIRHPADIFHIQEPQPAVDMALFGARLDSYLVQAAMDLSHPAIVVGDKTRLCEYSRYLPVLLAALATHGADPGRTAVYIAYGTHARQSDDQSRKAYGPAFDRYQWIHHQSDERTAFVDLGHTPRGTPVRIRADIMAASAVITFGAISHHYFAGYGGGRKLIFPGLGEKAAIYANHGLFLDHTRRSLAWGCRAGVLDGNPLAEDLADVEAFFPTRMAVHAIVDSHGRVCELLVGHGPEQFRAACARHAGHCEVRGGQYDLVLASCGGFPKDINLIQAHKAIDNAAGFVRDGGRLIVLAQCPDGIGSRTFLPWFEMGSWDKAFDRLAADYVGNGGTALSMMAKLQRIRIGVVTTLELPIAQRIGFERLTADQARREVQSYNTSWAMIPNASMVVRKV